MALEHVPDAAHVQSATPFDEIGWPSYVPRTNTWDSTVDPDLGSCDDVDPALRYNYSLSARGQNLLELLRDLERTMPRDTHAHYRRIICSHTPSTISLTKSTGALTTWLLETDAPASAATWIRVEVLRFDATVDAHLDIFEGNSSAALRRASFRAWAPPSSPTHIVYAPGPSLFIAIEGSGINDFSMRFEFLDKPPSLYETAAITKVQLLDLGAVAADLDPAFSKAPRLFDRRCARAGELESYMTSEHKEIAWLLVNAALEEWVEISAARTDMTNIHALFAPLDCTRCEARLLQAYELVPRSIFAYLQEWMLRHPCGQTECHLVVGSSIVSSLVRRNRRMGPYFVHVYRGVMEYCMWQSHAMWKTITDDALRYQNVNGYGLPSGRVSDQVGIPLPALQLWTDEFMNASNTGPLNAGPLLRFCTNPPTAHWPPGLHNLCNLVVMLEDVQAAIANLSETAEDVIEAAESFLSFGFHHRRTYRSLCRSFVARFQRAVHRGDYSSSDEPNGSSSPAQTTHQSPSQLVLAYATDVCQASLFFEHGTVQYEDLFDAAWLELLAAVTNTAFDPRGATRRARMFLGCVIGLGPSSNWPHNSAYVNGEPFADGTRSKPLEQGSGIPYNWYPKAYSPHRSLCCTVIAAVSMMAADRVRADVLADQVPSATATSRALFPRHFLGVGPLAAERSSRGAMTHTEPRRTGNLCIHAS
jgi:hypothetical protein